MDERANQELRDFISDNKRSNREKNAKHWSFVVLLWLGTIAVIFVLFTKVWHLASPPQYRWMEPEGLNRIDQFLTSGGIGAVIFGLFKSKIDDANKKGSG